MLFKDIDLKNIAKEFKEIDKNTFIMDLQSICEIDCLRIDKTNFLLSISCDGDSWELLQAKGSLYNLKARYIKVILQTPKKPKIEVLVRKYPGLFLMALGAGWGDRMIAFLNAMYLAKHTGFKFGFAWREINNSYAFSDSNKYQAIIIDNESKIFEKLEDFKIFKEDIALYIFNLVKQIYIRLRAYFECSLYRQWPTSFGVS